MWYTELLIWKAALLHVNIDRLDGMLQDFLFEAYLWNHFFLCLWYLNPIICLSGSASLKLYVALKFQLLWRMRSSLWGYPQVSPCPHFSLDFTTLVIVLLSKSLVIFVFLNSLASSPPSFCLTYQHFTKLTPTSLILLPSSSRMHTLLVLFLFHWSFFLVSFHSSSSLPNST